MPSRVDQSYEARLKRIEDKAVKPVEKHINKATKDITKSTTRQWIDTFGSTTAKIEPHGKHSAAILELRNELRAKVVTAGNIAAAGIDDQIDSAIAPAASAGSDMAINILGVHGSLPTSNAPQQFSQSAADELTAASEAIADKVATILLMVEKVDSFSDALKVIAAIAVIKAIARRYAAYVVNNTAGQQVEEQSQQAEVGLVWVAEQDACLECLAYSGETVQAGEKFESGLSFNPLSSGFEAGSKPPLHPNCRCHVAPWSDSWAKGNISYPNSLKREAQRSVLKGQAMDGRKARLTAAHSLLEQGTNLPKSVKNQARVAVQRGAFKAENVPGKRS